MHDPDVRIADHVAFDIECTETGRHVTGTVPVSTDSTPMQSRRQSHAVESICSDHQSSDHQISGQADSHAQSDKKDDDDPLVLTVEEDPYYWSNVRKWSLTFMVGSTFLNTTLASSMATGATEFYEEGFGASSEVATLVLSCYMIGFSFGPLIWSPLSEVIGRKKVFLISIPCFMLINIGCALSKNMATLLVLRVLAGFFGACPQSAAGATISDVFSPIERSFPMLVYSCCAFGGPVCGPLSGGFLFVSGHWRFIYWLLAIYAGVNSTLLALFQRESYGPVLRRQKAKRLRKDGHPAERAPIEMHMTAHELVTVHLVRPFAMLFNIAELPLIYAAVWTGWAYALLFIFFEAYPVIFTGIYGFNAGEEGLCFVAFGIGILLSVPVIWLFNVRTVKAIKNGVRIIPEARLKMVAFTAPLYVVGFFWFGWTARADIHWIVPLLATVLIGMSTILSFNALTVYVAQCYHIYAASALGALAFSRCFIAIFVPLFGRQMFEGLGPGWASSILGFVSLIAIPVPFIFARWGERIRDRSKLAITF